MLSGQIEQTKSEAAEEGRGDPVKTIKSIWGEGRNPLKIIKSIWCLLAKLGARVEDHWRKSLCPARWHKILTGWKHTGNLNHLEDSAKWPRKTLNTGYGMDIH